MPAGAAHRKGPKLRFAGVDDPAQHVLDDLLLARIRGMGGNQQVGKARDGIRVGAWGIGDGDAIVGGDFGGGRRGGYAIDRALHPVSGLVPDGRKVDVVLQRVNQLDVTDCARQLADLSRNTLVALAAHAGGPVDRGSRAGAELPFGAYFAQIVGEDEGGAAAVGAMDDGDLIAGEIGRRDCLWRCADRSRW